MKIRSLCLLYCGRWTGRHRQDKKLGGHQRLCSLSNGEMTGAQSMSWQWSWRGWTPKMLGDGRQRVWVVADELGRKNERRETPRDLSWVSRCMVVTTKREASWRDLGRRYRVGCECVISYPGIIGPCQMPNTFERLNIQRGQWPVHI